MTISTMEAMTKQEILQKFIAVGKAALMYDIEDSHSGNLAQKFVDENGRTLMAITATGAQKGALEPDDICFPGIDETTFGHYKASSETDIHAAILSYPGVFASMHAHTKYATIVTMDDEDKPNQPKPLIPIDPLGYYGLNGKVPVEWYAVACGSPQMVKTIPPLLKNYVATIVQGHGTFARGTSIEHAFYHLCLVNNSGYILYKAQLLKIDVEAIQRKVMKSPNTCFHTRPEPYTNELDGRCDFADEPQTVREFLKAGEHIFQSRLSPFHTGSISLRCVDTMLYAPKASMPPNLPGPLLEIPLEIQPTDSEELKIHKQIYANSTFQSVMHTYIPEAEINAYFKYPDQQDYVDRIIPIDVEGGFLYLVIPVFEPRVDFDTLLKALYDYSVVVIRGGGVWAVGEQSISEVLHHPSALRDICLYRIGTTLRGLNIRKLEPEKASNW
ncbi:hypothetical protein DRQ12_00345 [candidate division KSB1 bacterium]|nr:MAG: hypothetical protein DRQ12_00345 [candidate division KSB1 bacterium]